MRMGNDNAVCITCIFLLDDIDERDMPGTSYEDPSNPDIVSILKLPSPFSDEDIQAPGFYDMNISYEERGLQSSNIDSSSDVNTPEDKSPKAHYSDISEPESDPTLAELARTKTEDASSTVIGQMAASLFQAEQDDQSCRTSVVKTGEFLQSFVPYAKTNSFWLSST